MSRPAASARPVGADAAADRHRGARRPGHHGRPALPHPAGHAATTAALEIGQVSIAFTSFALCLIVAALECRSETGTVFTTATFDSKQMNWARARRVRARRAGHPDGRLQPAAGHHRRSRSAQFGWALVPALVLLRALGVRQGSSPGACAHRGRRRPRHRRRPAQHRRYPRRGRRQRGGRRPGRQPQGRPRRHASAPGPRSGSSRSCRSRSSTDPAGE